MSLGVIVYMGIHGIVGNVHDRQMFHRKSDGGPLCVYVGAVHPTEYRNSLYAFSSTVGRFGPDLAPLTSVS